MVSAIKNFHLPLDAPLYDELRKAAVQAGKPATKLASELVHLGLLELRRTQRRRDIASYAAAIAGTQDDLDEALETAGMEALLDNDT